MTKSAFGFIDLDSGFWAPCTIAAPKPDGGFRYIKLEVRFKFLRQDRIEEILSDGVDDGDGDLLGDVLLGWRAFSDPNTGEPIAYDEDSRREALNIPFIRSGLLKGFFATLNGQGRQSRTKNS